jgi:hypothetical protein
VREGAAKQIPALRDIVAGLVEQNEMDVCHNDVGFLRP